MTNKVPSADHSFYYHENANADFARMDEAAVYGNLADAMKNATVVLSPIQIIDTIVMSSPIENRTVTIDNTSEPKI